jgi:hypothetical protein
MNAEKMALIANELIEYVIEMNGLEWTIEFLFNAGYSYTDLIDMDFDQIDVKKVASDIGKIL